MFISFLYMFRATMCSSSGERTVFMRHLVLVILYEWLSGMHPPRVHTRSFLLRFGVTLQLTVRLWISK